jgi:hypothetical protein
MARKHHWGKLWRTLVLRSAHDWGVEFLAALEEAGAERGGPVGGPVRKRAAAGLDLTTTPLRLPGPPISVPPALRQH